MGTSTAFKPEMNQLCLQEKISEKSIADNVLEWRTGAINIDGCRIESDDVSVDRKKVVRKSRSDDGVWTNENSGMRNRNQREVNLQMQTQGVDFHLI